MSVALPVMSDLHLGQMAASKLDLKTSEYLNIILNIRVMRSLFTVKFRVSCLH